MNIQPGDWVRFQQNGQLVLAIVAYVRQLHSYPRTLQVITDHGTVDIDRVLEVRRESV